MRSLPLLLLLPCAALAQPQRTLAVSYFDVNATDPELMVLKKGLADMLISDLSVVKSVTIVEREKLNSALDELKLAKSPFVDPATAVKLGKGLSATHMLTGSLTAFKGKLRISARVFDVQSSAVLQGKDVEGDVGDFFALEKELVELLVAALELKPDVKEKAALRKSQTESLPALKSYAMGLDQLDRGDKESAQESFKAAQEADPNWQRVKAAVDSLKSAIGKAEKKREGTLLDKLGRLKGDEPDLEKTLEKLSAPNDIPYSERDLVKLQVLEYVAAKGWKPSRSISPDSRIGSSTRSHWEAQELVSLLNSFGDEPQAIRVTPVLFEYLARKYSDDATLLDRMRRDVENFRRRLEKADLKGPIPDYRGSGERIDRERAHHEFLNRLGKSVPLPKGLSRDPLESQKRVEDLLAKEKVRRKTEFESEFARRMKELKPSDEKLNEELGRLQIAAQEEDDRADGARKRVLLARWMVDHPDARPHSGTKDDPFWTEVSEFLQIIVRYRPDPSLWDVIPGAGEYLLKKYPDAKYLTSQLKLHLQSIEEGRKDGIERAAKRWAEESGRSGELQASKEVRELLKHAGDVGKKMK